MQLHAGPDHILSVFINEQRIIYIGWLYIADMVSEVLKIPEPMIMVDVLIGRISLILHHTYLLRNKNICWHASPPPPTRFMR